MSKLHTAQLVEKLIKTHDKAVKLISKEVALLEQLSKIHEELIELKLQQMIRQDI